MKSIFTQNHRRIFISVYQQRLHFSGQKLDFTFTAVTKITEISSTQQIAKYWWWTLPLWDRSIILWDKHFIASHVPCS